MPSTPITRHCPKCRAIMNLWKVAASPSAHYEAHTFACANCRFGYTARIDTPAGIMRDPPHAPTVRPSAADD
jgi:hypothetical protein